MAIPRRRVVTAVVLFLAGTVARSQEAAPPKGPIFTDRAIAQLIHDDLKSIDECHRRWTRYFVFRHVYGGQGEACLQALNKLTNSLSWSADLVKLSSAKPTGAFFCRIDLRNYQWDAKTWQCILAEYPYAVEPEGAQGEFLASATGTELPYVRGDWFIHAASRPSLYHAILGLPDNESELEQMLRISVQSNTQRGHVARSGFNNSGVSRHNRLVEVHKTGYGALWKSYDFSGNVGHRNLFEHPTGPEWGEGDKAFRHDGGEIIFNLPNGLQAYLLVNGKGQRIDTAPIDIVADTNNPRSPAIVNGISCIGCHYEGIKAVPDDQILRHVAEDLRAYGMDELVAVRALHLPSPPMKERQDAYARQFASVLNLLGISEAMREPIQHISFAYESGLDLATAAAEVGMAPEQFTRRLAVSGVELKRSLNSLKSDGGRIHRQAFIAAFPQMINEWGLGAHRVLGHLGGKATVEQTPPVTPDGNEQYPHPEHGGEESALPPAAIFGLLIPAALVLLTILMWMVLKLRAKAEARQTRLVD
jgi:hypothetical protein